LINSAQLPAVELGYWAMASFGRMALNILFIMYDQLRFDYLSCAGHPHLNTPNFDRVAAGVLPSGGLV
jgi:hypothetical protein